MEQRNISYYELAELEDEFIKQVTERGIIFPNDDLKSECYFDFVQQYIDGNNHPQIYLCYGYYV